VTRLGRAVSHRYAGNVKPKTLDHVAFWVADREPIVDFLTQHVGMHVIDQQDAFTLVGSDARRGKLTLFTADGPREQGAFKHVALRVSDLDHARAGLPGSEDVELGEGVRVRLVEAPTDVEYDLDHVALYSAEPEQTAQEYTALGFHAAEPSGEGHPRVEVGGAYVEFHPGDPGESEKPLLNHLAVLVDEVDPVIAEAEERAIVDNVVDAANTRAVFVWGPERVRIEYVEHKPGFALR
jgi:catechol 2,3-dioxygenase-like lactoylglutathione lyase family enzyme